MGNGYIDVNLVHGSTVLKVDVAILMEIMGHGYTDEMDGHG